MTATKLGRDVQVGDDLISCGVLHRVHRLEPYDATRVGIDDPGARIAHGSDGWGMTLFSTMRFQVGAA